MRDEDWVWEDLSSYEKKYEKTTLSKTSQNGVGNARQYNNNELSDKQKFEFDKCRRDDRQTLSISRLNQNGADLLIRRLTNRQTCSRKGQGSSHRGSFLGCGGLKNGNRRPQSSQIVAHSPPAGKPFVKMSCHVMSCSLHA